MPLPTREFFEALGRLTFQFAALEEMVGLCVLELDPSQDPEFWRTNHTFELKLKKLSADVRSNLAHIATARNTTELDDALAKAKAAGRTPNTLIHGVLHVHLGGELLLRNRAFGGTHPVNASAIDELTADVSALFTRFVNVRGECMKIRWTRERIKSSSAPL